jgi:hypothetical protein
MGLPRQCLGFDRRLDSRHYPRSSAEAVVQNRTTGRRTYWAHVPEEKTCAGMKTIEQVKSLLGEANVHGPFESEDAAVADADKVMGEGQPVPDLNALGSNAIN